MNDWRSGAHSSNGWQEASTASNVATTNNDTGDNNVTASATQFCVFLVIHVFHGTNVGIWDLVLLIPNAIFLLFLVATLSHSIRRLKSVGSAIYNTFYVLIFLTCVMGTIRCSVTMSVKGFNTTSDQVLWLTLRFFQLNTELCVLILGFLFGRMGQRRSIQRVLIITITISLAYVFTQGVLQRLFNKEDLLDHNIYSHGGVPFWFGSSLLFLLVYVCVILLRYVPCLNCCGLVVPVNVRFYYYSAFMAVLNLVQSAGSGVVLFTKPDAAAGFCMVDLTTFCLFSIFPPLIYAVFLWGFFRPGFINDGERSHLLDVSYNSIVGEDSHRSSVISNGVANTEKQPIVSYSGSDGLQSPPKGACAFPLSYNSLASTGEIDDLKDAMLAESLDDRDLAYPRSPSADTTRSYEFRTPLERSFVQSYESINGSAGHYNDTDLSDFEDLSDS